MTSKKWFLSGHDVITVVLRSRKRPMIASHAEFDGRFRNHNNNKVMPSSRRFFESGNVYMVLNGQTGECRELLFFFSASPSSYSFCIHVLRVISQISQSKNSKLDIEELTRIFFRVLLLFVFSEFSWYFCAFVRANLLPLCLEF